MPGHLAWLGCFYSERRVRTRRFGWSGKAPETRA